MSEHGTLTGADSKPSKRWRGKLFSKDKVKQSRDEQVDDFLSSSRQSQQPQPQPQPVEHQHPPQKPGVPAPRIDVSVSRRYPESTDPPSASPTLPQVAFPHLSQLPPVEATATAPAASTSTKKRPRKRGLRVAFSNATPEVIGEGGDDAETPTQNMVAIYRARSNSSLSGRSDGGSSAAVPPHSHSYSQRRAPADLTPPSLTIQNSGGSESGDQPLKPPLMHNAQDADFLLSIGADNRGSRLSFRGDPDQSSFARRVQAQMRAEEGKALQNRPDSTHILSDPDPEPEERTASANRLSSANPSSSKPEKSSGLSFWSDVMSSLPQQNNGSKPEYRSYKPPASTPAATETNPQTPPPPYAKAHPSQRSEHAREESRESSSREESRDNRDSSSSKKSLRSLATVVGDNASADFASYVSQYDKVFSLAAESLKPTMETSLSEWVRASAWWLLHGRADLESVMRSRGATGNASQSPPTTDQLQQAVVDLAKSWWINQHIVPRHPDLHKFGNASTDAMTTLARTAGDHRTSNLLGLHQTIIGNLRALSMSMKRNNILPAAASAQAALSRGVDTSIWLKYPFFSPDVSAVLSGLASRSMLVENSAKTRDIAEMMPMKDTDRYFCYGRMFVEAHISSGEDDSQQYAIPCMLSITRERSDWNVIVTITSQSELVNIVIQSDRKQGSTWADVHWQVRNCGMTLRLPRGFEFDIHFNEPDFKMLWKIVQYTRNVETSLAPEAGEKPIFEDILNVFQYFDTSSSGAFPSEPTQRCRIRLFEKSVQITEGTGSRESHRGFRLAAVTSPKVKSLSTVCHNLGDGAPILFSYLRGDDGAPALMLKLEEKGASYSMLMTFNDPEQRSKMHSLLMGVIPTRDEAKLVKDLPLKSFSMEPPGRQSDGSQVTTPVQFSSSSATVINELSDYGCPPTVLSEHLRVFVNSSWGSVTDRINLGPGELKINLDVNIPTALTVLRPAQPDLSVSIAENLVPKEVPGSMTNFIKTTSLHPILRKYNFASQKDMHKFQLAITGFKVLFDGIASIFAISRRRMVVPIYKKWETTKARVQIIEQEKVVQLVAFFDDFSHGKSMNFVLKSTDTFEGFSRSGKYGIRIVDAKFALPKGNDNDAAEFVCLDMPEYPGEHDDITIGFDSENESHNFQQAVPGSVKEPSRMGSLRK